MSAFHVPFSSSPPSTPEKKASNGKSSFKFGMTNPSTTPAGPPPSSSASFTPAGPPPSSFLGSSMLGNTPPVKPLSFSQSSTFEPSQLNFHSPQASPSPNSFKSPIETHRPRPPNEYSNYSEEEEEEEEEEEDDAEREYTEEEHANRYESGENYEDEEEDMAPGQDGVYDDDEEMDDYNSEMPGLRSHLRGYQPSSSDLQLATPPGLGDSQGMISLKDSFSTNPKAFVYGKVAREMYMQMGFPAVNESDDLVLGTEAIMTRLYDEGIGPTHNEDLLRHALASIPGDLTKLWATYSKKTAVYNSEEYPTAIGPGPKASNFEKANFLGCLTLRIYQPHLRDSKSLEPKFKPLPQILLEWMDEHHDPYPYQFEEIQAHRPSPANHRSFWDTVLNGLLRGKVVAVVDIMSNAGWRYAWGGMNGLQDQNADAGYSGVALANVEKAVRAATQVLAQCPAVHGDWNVRGSEWALFRMRASQALDDLKSFAEGRERTHSETLAGNAGLSGSYSRTARKAESQVPWQIYQNLLTVYSLVLGESNPIIENAQDWCEATIGLLAWWDEGREDGRLALGRSEANHRASSKHSEAEIYLRKLRRSFELATTETTDFHVNTLNPVEVGLASLLEGDNEAVIGFLGAWSGPVSSAVAEIASLAGWLPHAEPRNLITMGSLDQDDMDLLGINSSPAKADGVKDQALITYARSLEQRGQLKSSSIIRDGWELAIAILGRLDSATRSEDMVGDFLKDFRLDSSLTVDKLWRLLNDVGMARHAENITESYANQLAESSHNYGEALWYYALSHNSGKVKDVLDLLISLSLVQSTAYPPDSELDDHLKRLMSSPKSTLNEISGRDLEAAELLHKMLSGYATLRRFYSLRDEEVLLQKGGKLSMGTIARKKAAAAALLAVITSSDDNIRGGLYDENRGAVVNVDFLLALLGEALVFVNQPNFPITVSQIGTLLKAIEDIQSVGPRVYSACCEFLQTVIASGQGLKGSSPADMLRKSTSNVSGTSSFSLVGSSMLASQLKQSMGSSGVLVRGNIKRGWDWREGISAGTSAEDLLRVLRLGLAKDLAEAWLIEVDNKT